MRTEFSSPLVESVRVERLFGDRDIQIEIPTAGVRDPRLALLHGDNGSGKTTVLNLLWHLLSPADRSGHRTALARMPFKRLEVGLCDGIAVRAVKQDALLGTFVIEVARGDEAHIRVLYPADELLKVGPRAVRTTATNAEVLQGWFTAFRDLSPAPVGDPEIVSSFEVTTDQQPYLEFLRGAVGTPILLSDDRSLYSDDPQLAQLREVVRRRAEIESDFAADDRQTLVTQELEVTLSRVNDYLRELSLGGQSEGSESSNAIYLRVLNEMTREARAGLDKDEGDEVDLRPELERIAALSPAYERYGLVTKLEYGEFRRLFDLELSEPTRHLVNRVFRPYFESLQARYRALGAAYELLDNLIPTLNGFLVAKHVEFTPREGLRIVTDAGDRLAVASLSSGERQLLALLATTLLARDNTRLFLIDEPELSLGVEWQRKILDAVLGLTEGTPVQFLVATHSIEIISARLDSLVKLSTG